MGWHLSFLIAPICLSTAYVCSKSFEAYADWLLGLFGFATSGAAQYSNLTSVLEVAIGVNLALSFLASFSGYIGKLFATKVKDLDPDSNATFLEAMVEATKKHSQELGATLDVVPLQARYIQDVKQQIADFENDAAQSAKSMQLLGVFTAFFGFVHLVGVAKHPDGSLPPAFFWMLIAGILLPIISHFVFLGYQYLLYWLNIKAIKRNGKGTAYQAFIKEVHKIYGEKRRVNATIDKNL